MLSQLAYSTAPYHVISMMGHSILGTVGVPRKKNRPSEWEIAVEVEILGYTE